MSLGNRSLIFFLCTGLDLLHKLSNLTLLT